VVFGGGTLGSCVARQAAEAGQAVVVASRHQRAHPGWWRRYVVGSDVPLGWVPHAADVVVAIGPSGREGDEILGVPLQGLVERLRALKPRSLVVAGPAGSVPFADTVRAVSVAGAAAVCLSPLWGLGDGLIGRWICSLKEGHSLSIGRSLPRRRWLAATDAARAILLLRDAPGVHRWEGPEELDLAEAAALVARRWSGTVRTRFWGDGLTRAERARLADPGAIGCGWDDGTLGVRVTFAEWLERQPGPRRRSTESSPSTAARP
jgi:hypothetical protein